MSSNIKFDFILLSRLIHKLEDISYYRTFAKTLMLANNPTDSLPSDNELVKEMFHFFIREGELLMYYNGSVVSHDLIESEVKKRMSEKTHSTEDIERTKELERKHIWEKEVYIKIQDLKKLYANKCIVFPKSLLSDRESVNSLPAR